MTEHPTPEPATGPAARPASEATRIAYFALGGTIAMAGADQGGVVARLGGEQLLAQIEAFDALPAGVAVEVADPSAVPSASLTFGALLDVVDRARAAVDAGASGVVVSQGTDTLEETAFVIDSVWDRGAPVVVTGAMRNPTQPGHDGPANLLAAIQLASSSAARDRGVLVVFADEIHAARHVRKTHSTSIATFASPDLGPIGHVVENRVHLLAATPARTPVTGIDRDRLAATRVPLHTALLDEDTSAVEGYRGVAGLVVAGFGAGHVPAEHVPALAALAAEVPVVLTSRTGAGSALAETYAAPGAERDLHARGLLDGGFVHPYKARILLRLLIAAGADRHRIAAAFAELS